MSQESFEMLRAENQRLKEELSYMTTSNELWKEKVDELKGLLLWIATRFSNPLYKTLQAYKS